MAGSHRPSKRSAPEMTTADSPYAVPVISFVAPSGTGKTSLLINVVDELTSRGVRVGAIKHDAHRIELDTEGKDSWRLRQAGASETLLVGANQIAWMSADASAPDLGELLPLMETRVDIILVEGFRSAGLPCIVVHRPEADDAKWEPPDNSNVLATVHPSDVERVIELLATSFGVGR